MQTLPSYITFVFSLTTVATLWFFSAATAYKKWTFIVVAVWLVFQAIVGMSGFYTITHTFPPRFLALVLPPALCIIALFSTSKGRAYLDSMDLKALSLVHTVRIPVEIVLYWLYQQKMVPQLMTFEGSNYDILSGMTALAVYFMLFNGSPLKIRLLVVWNVICLGLLLNIVGKAVLSAPFPFQQLAFEQPNIAVLYFPFNWLPSCVVPLVLLSHLASLRQLFRKLREK